jgi:single-strand DNA-binding protein
MASFNSVHLVGTLTRDPEIKYLPKGTAVASFGLALNSYYTDKTGTKREETTFVDCEAFERTAEVIGEYCKKGSSILVDGRLKQDTWDDKTTGQKRSKLKVVVGVMQLLDRKPASATTQPDAGDNRPADDKALDGEPDEIPF